MGQSRAAAAALAMIAFGSVAQAATPAAGPKSVDYELAFAAAFPGAGVEHQITDWTLYAALVAGDLVAYAEKIDPAIAKRAADAKGKPYQTQQMEVSVRGDDRLVAAFNDQRRRLRSMMVYADGGGFAVDKCRHPLVYVKDEFRLVLGESDEGGDRCRTRRSRRAARSRSPAGSRSRRAVLRASSAGRPST